MIELQKDDIPVLDFITTELCKTEFIFSINCEYLKDKKVFGFGKNIPNSEEKDRLEFERLVSILVEYNCVDSNLEMPFSGELWVRKNNKTLQFVKQKGFKNEFKKQKKTLDWYKIIPICVAIFFGSLSAYQKYSYNSLDAKFETLEIENDSLKSELKFLKINLNEKNAKKEDSLLDTFKIKK